MSLKRRIRLTNLQTFKESFEVMWKSILSVCEFNQLNVIYYSYITESIKYGEWQRQAFSIEPLVFVNLQETSFIPEQIESFGLTIQTKRTFKKFQDVFFITNQRIIT